MSAEKESAAADEQAARARREAAEAEERARVAEREHQTAGAHEEHAQRIDPDVDEDGHRSDRTEERADEPTATGRDRNPNA